MKKTCGTAFISEDETLTCDRTGAHVVHRDGDTAFVRAPGGAIIRPGGRPVGAVGSARCDTGSPARRPEPVPDCEGECYFPEPVEMGIDPESWPGGPDGRGNCVCGRQYDGRYGLVTGGEEASRTT